MNEFVELFGKVIGVVSIVWPAVRSLIGYFMSKAKEIEDLRKGNTESSLRRLDDEVVKFRSAIDSLTASNRSLESSNLKVISDVKLLTERFEDHKKMMDQYSSNFRQDLKNTIRSEVIELGKEARMLKQKQAGSK